MMKFKLVSKKKAILVLLSVCFIHFYFILPKPLFKVDYSEVLLSSNNELLSVNLAKDEQWRFPFEDSLSNRYKTSVLLFEDEYFDYHFGVNPISVGRALFQNIKADKVKSGGSTLTMQLVRMSRGNPSRTIWEKIVEMYIAIRVECSYSKGEILKLYASNAPFGGNVVGVSAAGWKYYGRALSELSWAEAATLAVLPNSPSLIFPGKNQILLKEKRNRLLKKLLRRKEIDQEIYSLAIEEPLPDHFISYPRQASHALDYLKQNNPQKNIFKSTLDNGLQIKTNSLLQLYIEDYSSNHIHNGAILIIDNYTNQVVSYVGNVKPQKDLHENFVDLIQAPRSSGSILKPFLHAAALDDGLILNGTILPDIPTVIEGFAPQNYSKSYEGAVSANSALARSLNVPAVRLLQKYGYPRFHLKLKELGMSTLKKESGHYGLSLILGGAETTLWDLGKMYSGLATTLNKFEDAPLNKSYSKDYFKAPTLLKSHSKELHSYTNNYVLSAPSIYETFEALLELKRPYEQGSWKLFENSRKIAWKTGTSHGFRDAWAVGVSPHYTVAVWVGNATGEGRPGLVGVKKAAPIMFSVFNYLPHDNWFSAPKREMYPETICKQSGMKASVNCFKVDTVEIGKVGKKSALCSFCKKVYVNKDGERVNSSCSKVSDMEEASYFVLPPVQEWYYVQKSVAYHKLPHQATGCDFEGGTLLFDFIYPYANAKIYIPKELEGQRGKLVCRATHKQRGVSLYWHLDDQFLGSTVGAHQMDIDYEKGKHVLLLVDEQGQEKKVKFEVL